MSTNTRALVGGDIEAGSFNSHFSDIERNALPIEAPIEEMADSGHINVNVADIEKWASSLENMLEDLPTNMCNQWHPGRIGKIPENLREVDPKSYEPSYLAIGPYHNGKPSLQSVEKTKWIILKYFLEHKPDLTLKDMVKVIKSIEPEARRFYTDVKMETEKFVQMLLLDSLYLVILFCGMPKKQGRTNHTNSRDFSDNEDQNECVNQINEGIGSVDESEDSQMMERVVEFNGGPSGKNSVNDLPWFWTLLVHDLFLLENQLPYFVLQKMHDLVYDGSETPLIVALKNMFQDLLFEYVKLDSEMLISPNDEIHHLLHLCHLFFRPTLQQDRTTCQHPELSQIVRLGNAVQLYEAGVSFEAKSSSSQHSLLDVTFRSFRKMVMPCLHVDDNTNSLLRNLIALEQMKYPCMGLNVSAYAVLLLHLVTMPEDVKLLRRKGIIQHHLASDKEMMYVINRLSVGLTFDYIEDEYYLKPVFHELKRLSKYSVPRWRAMFSNPWTTMSLMAASLLLLLTLLQTFYAVYSYYHPYFNGRL